MAYGNKLDKDPNNIYNWIGFSTSLILSVTPVTNIGKIPIKFVTKSDKYVFKAVTALTSEGYQLSFDLFLEIGDKLLPIRLE